MQGFDVIFFDLDHTLVDTRGQYAKGLAIALGETYPDGYPPDFQKRFLYHHERLWREYDARRLPMQEVRRQRFILAWRDFGVERSVAQADAFYETYSATLPDTLFPFPGVRELVEKLSHRYRLGIITNGSPDLQWKKLCITELEGFFPEESLIISEKIGKAKPDKTVFQYACDALSVSPSRAVMVGDNYDKDVLGARLFGMEALWLVPDPEMAKEARAMGVGETPTENPLHLLDRLQDLERQRFR